MNVMKNTLIKVGLLVAICCTIPFALTTAYGDIAREPEDFHGALRASGRVYRVRDDGSEEALAGVRVMAGGEVAVTNDEGHYTIALVEPFHVVSVSFPDGSWPVDSWFRRMYEEEETGVDFAFCDGEQDTPFLFIHFSDPHSHHPRTMPMLREEGDRLPMKPRFYVGTGDMRYGYSTTRDMEDLHREYKKMRRSLDGMGAPVFLVPGNHDGVGIRTRNMEGGIRLTEEELRHPYFGYGAWERYVFPAHWSFTYAGIHFMGVEFPLYCMAPEGDFNDPASWFFVPTVDEIRAWVVRELGDRPPGIRSVLVAHNTRFLANLVTEGLDITFGLGGHGHRPYRWGFPENVYMGGTLFPPGGKFICSGSGSWRLHGYNLVMVEEDRIDVFFRPLGWADKHVINVYEPFPLPTEDTETPAEITVIGQVLDLEGTLEKVTVRVGEEEAEARMIRRRLWVDFEAPLTLHDHRDYIEALRVYAEFPDGVHVLESPFKEWDWTVRKWE